MQDEYNTYKEKYGDLYDAQLRLESTAKEEAENNLKTALETARLNGEAGQGRLAEKFMSHTWESSRHNIRALIAEALNHSQ